MHGFSVSKAHSPREQDGEVLLERAPRDEVSGENVFPGDFSFATPALRTRPDKWELRRPPKPRRERFRKRSGGKGSKGTWGWRGRKVGEQGGEGSRGSGS